MTCLGQSNVSGNDMCNLLAETFKSQYVAPSSFHLTVTSKALGGRGPVNQSLIEKDMEESPNPLWPNSGK